MKSEEQGRRLVDWLAGDVLAAWARIGFDANAGHGFERLLSFDAADTEADVRTRTQARQIYAFCAAHVLGWPTDARARVDALSAFVETHCRQDDGDGYIRSLSADLSARDAGHDLYDHGCFLLADAWRFRAFGDQSAVDDAERIIRLLDDRFAHPAGGWAEGDYVCDYRRQNPHMHMFEALLALHESTDDDYWLARADEVYELFVDHFFQPGAGVLLEFFDDEWRPAPGEAGATAEPGHMMEWVWLLRCYERQSGTSTAKHADALFKSVRALGQSDSGLLYDAIGVDGSLKAPTKRLWPMPELIKAGIGQSRFIATRTDPSAAIASYSRPLSDWPRAIAVLNSTSACFAVDVPDWRS